MSNPQKEFELSLTPIFLREIPQRIFEGLNENPLVEKYEIASKPGVHIIVLYPFNKEAYTVCCSLSQECYKYWQKLNDSHSA